jgi:hypothetical protein
MKFAPFAAKKPHFVPGIRAALFALKFPPLILDQDGQRVEDLCGREG